MSPQEIPKIPNLRMSSSENLVDDEQKKVRYNRVGMAVDDTQVAAFFIAGINALWQRCEQNSVFQKLLPLRYRRRVRRGSADLHVHLEASTVHTLGHGCLHVCHLRLLGSVQVGQHNYQETICWPTITIILADTTGPRQSSNTAK